MPRQERLRGVARDPARLRRAGDHPDRARRGSLGGARAGARRRRLSGQAVQPAGPAGADQGGAAPRREALARRAAQPDFAAAGLAINFQSHEVTLRGEPVRLTPVEYKLLHHLARNAGRLLSHQALLDAVWGADYVATTDYLKVFISRLRAKLEPQAARASSRPSAALGYRFIRARMSMADIPVIGHSA